MNILRARPESSEFMARLTQAQECQRFLQMTKYEQFYYDKGATLIAGVDEAGRGPLAGPLVVAAVILPKEVFIPGLNDSKKVSEKKRNLLYEEILKVALAASVNIVSVSNIDSMNIYNATRMAMAECLKHLDPKPQIALVDAMEPFVEGVETVPIIKGDALSISIAAASILAKVTRDWLMVRLDALYPEYGFAQHKGYGTAKHMAAIRTFGALEWHRRSYEPIKSMGLRAAAERQNELYNPLRDREYQYKL